MARTIIIKKTAGNAPRVTRATKKAHRRKQPVVANPARQQRASARVQRLIAQIEERKAELPAAKDKKKTHIPADEALPLARFHVVLALLCGNIANAPVGRCAIIRSVRRAAESGAEFSAGELLLLAYVKIPCAIDYLVTELPSTYAARTRAAWRKAAADAIGHFKARCSQKGGDLSGMDLAYRKQRECVANGIETTSGLPYLHDAHIEKRDDAAFDQIRQWQPGWKKPLSGLAKELKSKKNKLEMGGTRYKRTHAARTVAAALCQSRPAAGGEAFLQMSDGLEENRNWLYPKVFRDSGPKMAAAWLARQCGRVVTGLGADQAEYAPLIKEVANMSAGDEACLACEAGHVAGQLTPAQISAMKWAIRSNKGHDWRQGVPWYGGAVAETADSGVFAGVKESATELTQLHQQAKHRRLGAC